MINILESWRNPNETFIGFDVETNGLNMVKSQVYQLSYVIYKGGKKIKEVDDYIYHENFIMRKEAAKINKFNQKKYEKLARPLEEVMERFKSNAKGNIMFGHNVLNFDIYMLNCLYNSYDKDHDFWFMDRIIDTNALSKCLFLKRNNQNFENWEDFTAWQMSNLNVRDRSLKSSQSFMLKHFGINFDPDLLHEALYDVEKNKEILEKLIFQLKI